MGGRVTFLAMPFLHVIVSLTHNFYSFDFVLAWLPLFTSYSTGIHVLIEFVRGEDRT